MEKRSFQSKRRYILAVVIATIVFAIGFLITYSISYGEYLRISNIQGELSYRIFQDKIKYSFFKEDICSLDSLTDISEDLAFQGRIINDLETKLGKNDERVLFRKKFYTLIALEHYEFVSELNKKCKSNISIILFFYSNEEKELDESEKVGNILGVVYERNPNVKIYSFDINLDSELIELLKKKYRIEKSPTLIIREQHKVTEVENINDIEKLIK